MPGRDDDVVSEPTADELRAAYEVERWTLVEVGLRYGWGATKARKKLAAAGVTLRRPGTEKRTPRAMMRERREVDGEWLRARYERDGWSLRDLADELGRSKTHMGDLLTRAGIAVRPHERDIDIGDLTARTARARRCDSWDVTTRSVTP